MAEAATSYWLYQWLDENGVRKSEDLSKVLRHRQTIDRLLELDANASAHSIPPLTSGQSLIAGRRIDLSGHLGCAHVECILPQIDKLFARTWHYFDTIVVDDPQLTPRKLDPDKFLWDLKQRAQLLLYLRKIGATEHIAFKRKVSGLCDLHFREFAIDNDLGLDVLFDDALQDRVVRELLSSGAVEIEQRGDDGWHYTIQHPRLETILGTYSHSDAASRPSEEDVVRDAFGRYCGGLISDVAAARDLRLPLLQVAEGIFLPEPGEDRSAEDIIALQLRLPILMNVSAKEILRRKHEDWPEFERFRKALREAIRKQIEKAGTKSPEEIAKAVVQEDIIPELAIIEGKLTAIQKSLARKVNASIALGGATVTAGAIASIPLVIATGVAAIATSVQQIYNYYDGKKDIEESDLYFLWKAAQAKHKTGTSRNSRR